MKNKSFKLLCLTLAVLICGSFSACDISGFEGINSDIFEDMSGNSDSISGSADENPNENTNENPNENQGGENKPTVVNGDLQIHFLQLGNKISGDCTLIDIGDTEVLIDAGSTTGSIGTIIPYIKKYCTDGILEYVIATHGDQDHIAGFTNSTSQGKGVFESFECSMIIDFPKTVKTTQVYNDYVSLRDQEVENGAKHYTALECWNNENGAQRSYALAEGITLNILYQKYYEQSTSEENNNSVCAMITQGENNYLFTGDLQSGGEASLVANNNLPKCKLFKSGHHGSSTSNTTALLSVIQPEIFVITCCCGDKFDFPSQQTIDNIALYTKLVYAPLAVKGISSFEMLNGNIVVSCKDGKTLQVNCSNNNILLKDTAWFKANRTMPEKWKK